MHVWIGRYCIGRPTADCLLDGLKLVESTSTVVSKLGYSAIANKHDDSCPLKNYQLGVEKHQN